MARKRGAKNANNDIKDAKILQKLLEEGKNQREIAEEMGMNRNTVSFRINKLLSQEEVSQKVAESKNRLLKMLTRCDAVYLKTLEGTKDEGEANRIKVAQSIYRSFGVVNDQAKTEINQTTAIQINTGLENLPAEQLKAITQKLLGNLNDSNPTV